MALLRHRLAALAAASILGATMAGGVPASAQTTTPTTYTPGTSVPPACTAGGTNAGTVAVGQTATVVLCGPFQPGTSVAASVDGQTVGAKVAAANGTITVVLTVTSNTTADVNDPTTVNITCGDNTVTGTGPGQSGAATTQTGTFNVVCAAATKASGLALTGANVLKTGLAALALIVIGGALVLAQRRRRSTDAL